MKVKKETNEILYETMYIYSCSMKLFQPSILSVCNIVSLMLTSSQSHFIQACHR